MHDRPPVPEHNRKRLAQARNRNMRGPPERETIHYSTTRHAASTRRDFGKINGTIGNPGTGEANTAEMIGQSGKPIRKAKEMEPSLMKMHQTAEADALDTFKQRSFLFSD